MLRRETWLEPTPAPISDFAASTGQADANGSKERARRQACNHSTVNSGALNHTQHVLSDVSMLLGKCAPRSTAQHRAAPLSHTVAYAAEDDPLTLLLK